MKPRFLVLLFMLTLVVGVTAWRTANPNQRTKVSLESLNVRPAPEFQLLDQNSRPIQLKGYLGRHRILLRFFDGIAGPDADPVLRRLKEVYPELKRSQIVAFGISSPLGPQQKDQTLSYPFPILRDTLAGQPGSCCVAWGVTEISEGSPGPARVKPALFLIEANGLVGWDVNSPKPVANAEALINALVRGQ
jgi:peroxiredoxin